MGTSHLRYNHCLSGKRDPFTWNLGGRSSYTRKKKGGGSTMLIVRGGPKPQIGRKKGSQKSASFAVKKAKGY